MANLFTNLPRDLAEKLQHQHDMAARFAAQQSCRACPRHSGGCVPAQSAGPRPYLAIVLPAPTAWEKANAAPMLGSNADDLFALLEQHAGIQRSAVYICYAASCYSPADPTKEEIATCQHHHRAMHYTGALVIWHFGPVAAQASTSTRWEEICGKAVRRGLQFDVFTEDARTQWNSPANRPRIIEDLQFIGDLARMPFMLDAWRIFKAGLAYETSDLAELMGELDKITQEKHKARFLNKVVQALAMGPTQGGLF